MRNAIHGHRTFRSARMVAALGILLVASDAFGYKIKTDRFSRLDESKLPFPGVIEEQIAPVSDVDAHWARYRKQYGESKIYQDSRDRSPPPPPPPGLGHRTSHLVAAGALQLTVLGGHPGRPD